MALRLNVDNITEMFLVVSNSGVRMTLSDEYLLIFDRIKTLCFVLDKDLTLPDNITSIIKKAIAS
ncbi:hypothetical protein J6590_014451 [Homalodisca vitripennis]|nr:hypothetical protein J6590_014451 [Homalodisca vitripennis]